MKLIHFFEKIDDMKMGDVIKDFYKSDAPQFKGKSKKKRRDMAIAAKLSADEGVEESGCLGKQIKKGKAKKSESFDPRAEQSREDQAYEELVDAYDKGGEEGLCKAIGCSMEELDQEMSEFARDHNLHMDDDRDEIIHGYIEQLVDDADWKDHGEQDMEMEESFKHFKVKHKKSGKEYKITAMHDKSAKEKARAKHGGTASRYTGTSTDDFEIVESCIIEDIDLNDNMLGTPDSYYDEEERKEAYLDLKDAMEEFPKGWERESVMNGICPNCAGTGYQDGEYPEYDDDGEEIEDSAFECDGYGMYGCDEGEMVGASWLDIVKHDERQAERQKAKDNYPGDEAVIDQIARAVKKLEDPRQMYQYMKADYPFMGMAQRSALIAKGMKKAGLTSESLNEGEERSIIHDATVEKLVDEFSDRVGEMESMEELHDKMYTELEYLDVDEVVDPDMEVGGQRIGDYANGRVIDILDSGSVMDEVTNSLDLSDLQDRDSSFPYQYEEGTIDQTFATDNIDKHDKKFKRSDKEEDKKKVELELLKKLSGIKNEGRPLQYQGIADTVVGPNGKEYVFDKEKNMFISTNTGEPGGPEKVARNTPLGKKLFGKRKYQMSRLDSSMYSEDAEGDASESAVAKMIAKALGDENRWTEMSAAELYAELESQNTEMADVVKDVAKMIYGVQLSESRVYEEITLEDDQDFTEEFGILGYSIDEENTFEAEYRGRKVKLNKPMRGDVKKFKVYVKDPKTGNVKKVNFGHGGTSAKRKTMRIRKSNPKARKSFRARHNCDNPGPKTKARYWSCRKW